VLETAIALGAPNIRIWAGRVDGGCATDAQKDAVVEDLRHICDLARECDVRVSTEFHAGTLTSTAEQTCWLLEKAAQSNLRTYWQPASGKSVGECADELEKLIPHLENLHVFHWHGAEQERRALREGESIWTHYLALAAARAPHCRFALLEFVAGDALETLWSDAHTLHTCLNKLSL
jgi:sugar phosphate isomerase/epimerase